MPRLRFLSGKDEVLLSQIVPHRESVWWEKKAPTIPTHPPRILALLKILTLIRLFYC